MRSVLLSSTILLITSCVLAEDIEPDNYTQSIFSCPECGHNTDFLLGQDLYGFDLNGKANDHGMALVGVRNHLGEEVELVVSGDVLSGDNGFASTPLLANSVLTVSVSAKEAKTLYEIRILEVETSSHWADPLAANDNVTSYRLAYQLDPRSKAGEDVCPEVGPLGDTPFYDPSNGTTDLPEHHAVLFVGDRYDLEEKRAEDGDHPSWLNIACKGSAVNKLHLTRHTAAGSNAAHQTPVGFRTALARMFLGDYCGEGSVNTVLGHELRYLDDQDWFQHFYLPASDFWMETDTIEAIWSEKGAYCLVEPRLKELSFEDIKCDDEEQVLRKCTGRDIAKWREKGHLISSNPAP